MSCRRNPGVAIGVLLCAAAAVLVPAQRSAAVVRVCGPIAVDTVWAGGDVYVMDCIVTVQPGVTLRIEPGAVVKLILRDFFVDGTLIAEGTADAPVVFTSAEDDAWGGDTNGDGPSTGQPGQWAALTFNAGSQGRLSHAILQYGGGYYFHYGSKALVRSFGGDVALDQVTLRASAAHGLYAENAVDVTRSRIADNGEWGLYYYSLGSGRPLEIADNVFSGPRPGLLQLDGEPGLLTVRDNRIEGAPNGFSVRGVLRGALDWENDSSFVMLVASNLEVAASGSLRLAPGSLVKLTFGAFDGGELIVNGNLEAVGTAAAPIVFTSLQDDAYGGDTNGDGTATTGQPGQWSAVTFGAGSRGAITHAVARYGGGYYFHYSSRALIRSFSDEVGLEDVELSHSGAYGLYAENGPMVLRGCRITDNAAHGVFNYTPSREVDARRVWWGDASGPLHPKKNPSGLGDEVSDGVLFFPWAVDVEGTVPMQVHVEGPVRVSPGGPAEYALSYYASAPVADAVLVFAVPAGADFADTSAAGLYRIDAHEAFFRLGDLEEGAEGRVSISVAYRFGLPEGETHLSLGKLVGQGLDGVPLDTYYAFAPAQVTGRTILTSAEIQAERADHALVDALCQRALARGLRLLGGVRSTVATGESVVRIIFVRGPTVAVVERQDVEVALTTLSPTHYAVEDDRGAVEVDTQARSMAGSLAPAGASGAATAAASITREQCLSNCILEEVRRKNLPIDAWQYLQPHLPRILRCEGELPLAPAPRRAEEPLGRTAGSLVDQCLQRIASALDKILKPVIAPEPPANRLPAVHYKDCARACTEDPDRHRCAPGSRAVVCTGDKSYQALQCENGVYVRKLEFLNCGKYEVCDSSLGRDPPCKWADCEGEPPAPGLTRAGGGAAAARSPCDAHGTTIFVARDPNEKSGPQGDLIPGQAVQYRIEYENVGAGSAYEVYVTDRLSPHLDETTLDLGGLGEYLPVTRTVVWEIGELAPKGAPGSKGERSFAVRVRAGLPGGTVVSNGATVYFPSVPEETATNRVVNVVQPVAALPQELETEYDTPVEITLAGRDVGGTPLTFRIEDEPVGGDLVGEPPSLTYAPAANFTGQDRFTFTASNGVSTSRAAPVTIRVAPSSLDTMAPEVLWTYPVAGAVIEEVSSEPIASDDEGSIFAPSLLAGFGEAMDAATVVAGGVEVRDDRGQPVAASLSWDGTRYAAVLSPRQAWRDGAYTATVTTAVHDASGNALAADYVWSFRIGAPPACTGDCDGDGAVTIDELIRGVTIALGTATLDQCPAFDADASGDVTINELVQAVNNALAGCPAPSAASASM